MFLAKRLAKPECLRIVGVVQAFIMKPACIPSNLPVVKMYVEVEVLLQRSDEFRHRHAFFLGEVVPLLQGKELR